MPWFHLACIWLNRSEHRNYWFSLFSLFLLSSFFWYSQNSIAFLIWLLYLLSYRDHRMLRDERDPDRAHREHNSLFGAPIQSTASLHHWVLLMSVESGYTRLLSAYFISVFGLVCFFCYFFILIKYEFYYCCFFFVFFILFLFHSHLHIRPF